MSARDQLVHWLDSERDRQLEFLRAFTRIDTCNPPGDTTEAADLFRRFLDAEGIGHRTEAPQAANPNLISSFTGKDAGRHLVLNGHLDVFPVGDASRWSRSRVRRPRPSDGPWPILPGRSGRSSRRGCPSSPRPSRARPSRSIRGS